MAIILAFQVYLEPIRPFCCQRGLSRMGRSPRPGSRLLPHQTLRLRKDHHRQPKAKALQGRVQKVSGSKLTSWYFLGELFSKLLSGAVGRGPSALTSQTGKKQNWFVFVCFIKFLILRCLTFATAELSEMPLKVKWEKSTLCNLTEIRGHGEKSTVERSLQ